MDPSDSRRGGPPTRLPRTRGDGPASICASVSVSTASPHTRGWTHARDWRRFGDGGFPAHAGMDPHHGGDPRPGDRLPRTRGDGPQAANRATRVVEASPHTRGWTLLAAVDGQADAGFPAHAGMDPHFRLPPAGRPGLPRTRGDGPRSGPSARASTPASPHTRGWTSSAGIRRRWTTGFPAHAGMDPTRYRSRSFGPRLPRTRGDGPSAPSSRASCSAASPHTRGWTSARYPRGTSTAGFPAHAGMDPRARPPTRKTTRLPRTRGDGPGDWTNAASAEAASPHTRGWTPCAIERPQGEAGFPAHAGMDPRLSRAIRSARWLPRTRGDGPALVRHRARRVVASPHTRGWTRVRVGRERAVVGFPAHAGMDPARPSCARGRKRLPRTRGDGPGIPKVEAKVDVASPHTRGWTRGVKPASRWRSGFPAHAGMDPERPSSSASGRRLPRTRGDGPCAAAVASPAIRASPHTRGWTAETLARDEGAEGFPAHAGMDPRRNLHRQPRPWLPRTRGDGPVHYSRAQLSRWASPHTRGWTLSRRERPELLDGFPHTRGWTVQDLRRRQRLLGASPHTRGWTRPGRTRMSPRRGFPAHAGMDPAAAGWW